MVSKQIGARGNCSLIGRLPTLYLLEEVGLHYGHVKPFLPLLLTSLVLAGCATSTVETRRSERAASYASLPPDVKALVDQGRIKVGMPMDAVYIAWGPPAQVLQSESEGGAATIWLYEGGWMEENRYWSRRRLEHDYQPRTYVRAQVVFVNGRVKEWHTLPQPVN